MPSYLSIIKYETKNNRCFSLALSKVLHESKFWDMKKLAMFVARKPVS